MRAVFGLLGLVLTGCSCSTASILDVRDAAPDSSRASDTSVTDAAPLDDASRCGDHASIRAPRASYSCSPVSPASPACDATIDAPTFESVGGGDMCDAARASPTLLFRDELTGAITIDASCAGTSFLLDGRGYRLDPQRHTYAAVVSSRAEVARVVAEARIDAAGECVRWLRVEMFETGPFEILDLPPGGATAVLEPRPDGTPRSVTVSSIPGPSSPCPESVWICLAGDLGFYGTTGEGIALAPCGVSGLPIGGCGDETGVGIVGSASCGGRIHAAIYASDYVPICH